MTVYNTTYELGEVVPYKHLNYIIKGVAIDHESTDPYIAYMLGLDGSSRAYWIAISEKELMHEHALMINYGE